MKEKLASLGALVSASLASICCLGPVVLAGVGLGGASLAAGLVKYRPLFLGLTGAFLASAFYLTYRKRPIDCADGRCEWRAGSRSMKTALWIVAVLVAGLVTYPYWTFLLRDYCAPLR